MKAQFCYGRRRVHNSLATLAACFTTLLILTVIASPAYGSGQVRYFLTGDSLSDSAQKVTLDIFEDQSNKPDKRNGWAFLYDSKTRGGGFSLDYYALSETYDDNDMKIREDTVNLLALGYRLHFPLHFYFGIAAGIADVEHTFMEEKTSFLPTLTPTFTVGWSYISPIKLTFGIHLLRTSARTLTSDDGFQNRILAGVRNPLCDNPDPNNPLPPDACEQIEDDSETKKVDDFDVNLIGITIGFAW